MSADPYKPQKNYLKRNAKKGLVRITSWVPEEDRARALQYCAQLRKKSTKKEGV